MKSIFSIIALLMIISNSNATEHIVLAQGTTIPTDIFVPDTVNAVVGDTVTWIYVDGFHTTESTVVPSGAASWANNLISTDTTFSYELTHEGVYNYTCHAVAPHGMDGTIIVAYAFGECTPDPSITLAQYPTGTFQPSASVGLPCALVGQPYVAQIDFVIPPTTTVSGATVNLDSIRINSVSFAPTEFNYSCGFASCSWPSAIPGCLTISSNSPLTVGTHVIDIYATIYATLGQILIPVDTHITDYILRIFATQTAIDADTNCSHSLQYLSIIVPTSQSICSGDTVQLFANVSNGTSPYIYNWSPPTGLSNPLIQNPIASPIVNTTYYVTVTK